MHATTTYSVLSTFLLLTYDIIKNSGLHLWKMHSWVIHEAPPHRPNCSLSADMWIHSTSTVQSTWRTFPSVQSFKKEEKDTDPWPASPFLTLQPLIWEIKMPPVWYFSGLLPLRAHQRQSWPVQSSDPMLARCHFFSIKGQRAPTINKAGVN